MKATERPEDEHPAGTSANRFAAIFAQSPLGISVTDSRTRIICDANPRFAEICGREVAEIVGLDWVELTHPDDVDEDLQRCEPGVGEVLPFRLPKRYVKPDGNVVWVEMSIAPLGLDDDGDPLHLCMIDDVTDRKGSEVKLAQLGKILESTPDYAATTDLNGRIVWSNAACRSLAGVSSVDDHAVERHSLFALMTPTSRDRFFEEAVPALWAGGCWQGEIEGLLPDGATFPLSFVAIAHSGPDGYPAFCSVTRIADPSDALGLGWGRVLHPDDAQAVGSQWAMAIKTDQPLVGQFRFLTPDGRVVSADIEAVPVRHEDGRTYMFLGTVDDITERLELARAVRGRGAVPHRVRQRSDGHPAHRCQHDRADGVEVQPALRRHVGPQPGGADGDERAGAHAPGRPAGRA